MWMIVLGIYRQDMLENLGEKMLVIFDLLKVLMEGKVFRISLKMLCQKKYLLVCLLYLVHLNCMSVMSNMVGVRWILGS